MHQCAPGDIAFGKCVVAFLILSLWVLLTRKINRALFSKAGIVAVVVCAGFGIFGLYTFETIAYKGLAVPMVVLTLIASSTITTFLAGHFFFGERITANTLFSLLLIMSGLWLMLPLNMQASPFYLVMAACSGACYGTFLLCVKKFKLAGGLYTTWVMIGIGDTLSISYNHSSSIYIVGYK